MNQRTGRANKASTHSFPKGLPQGPECPDCCKAPRNASVLGREITLAVDPKFNMENVLMRSSRRAAIDTCGSIAALVFALFGPMADSYADEAACAPIVNAMKKQSAVPVFGATSMLDDKPGEQFVFTRTHVFVAMESGGWRRRSKTSEERDQARWLAKYASQLHACSTGVPDTVEGAAATLYVAQLGTVLIREWIGAADGLPIRQEASLPRVHKRLTVWDYTQTAVPQIDGVQAE